MSDLVAQPVQSVKVELEVGKETKEVIDLVGKILEGVKAKKNPAQIVTDCLEPLYKAVEGVGGAGAEAKMYLPGEAGYLTKVVFDALNLGAPQA